MESSKVRSSCHFLVSILTDASHADKVNLDDLLASFATSKNPKLAALRKTLKPLAAASSTSTKSTSLSHLKASGPLAAPLPARLQDKIEREAGYEKTKEETDKWNATVRRMKGETGVGVEGARHERLTLPLMGGAGNVLRDANASEWSAKFQVSLSPPFSTIEHLLIHLPCYSRRTIWRTRFKVFSSPVKCRLPIYNEQKRKLSPLSIPPTSSLDKPNYDSNEISCSEPSERRNECRRSRVKLSVEFTEKRKDTLDSVSRIWRGWTSSTVESE